MAESPSFSPLSGQQRAGLLSSHKKALWTPMLPPGDAERRETYWLAFQFPYCASWMTTVMVRCCHPRHNPVKVSQTPCKACHRCRKLLECPGEGSQCVLGYPRILFFGLRDTRHAETTCIPLSRRILNALLQQPFYKPFHARDALTRRNLPPDSSEELQLKKRGRITLEKALPPPVHKA
jgi:hypothetical protein